MRASFESYEPCASHFTSEGSRARLARREVGTLKCSRVGRRMYMQWLTRRISANACHTVRARRRSVWQSVWSVMGQ